MTSRITQLLLFLVIPASLHSMYNANDTHNFLTKKIKKIELITQLKTTILHDLTSSIFIKEKNEFADCINNITTSSSLTMKINKCENDPNPQLLITVQKKKIFHAIYFKKNLIQFYKQEVARYKKPFEEENLTLKTDFGEDDTSLTFIMRLKQEEKEPLEDLFNSFCTIRPTMPFDDMIKKNPDTDSKKNI